MPRLIHLLIIIPVIPVAALADAGPKDVAAAFHDALNKGQRERLKGYVTPDVVIFEGGGVESSFSEYASHHLGADIEFSKGTRRNIEAIKQHHTGDVAWVLTYGTTKGTFRNKDINSEFTETMLLKRTHGHWQIAHIHWPSRKLK